MRFFKDFIDNLLTYGLEYFGLYYGCYRAYVHDVEDPENCNRLRLIIPHIDPRIPLKTWALPKNVFAGQSYGSQILPKKGDTVWVEFENGKPNNPLWIHGFYIKGEKPEEFENTQTYGFKTPMGHFVKIDDLNNIIQVTQKDGVTLLINNGEYSICKDESKLQPLVLGEELQKQLNTEKDRVTALINAINNAAIVPTDGGASLKASIIASMATVQKPDYSKINSEIGKIQ